MTIKAATPSYFFVFSFWFVVYIVKLLLETLMVSLDTLLLLVTLFLLQDIFDIFSCIILELKLLFNPILFCWIALLKLG